MVQAPNLRTTPNNMQSGNFLVAPNWQLEFSSQGKKMYYTIHVLKRARHFLRLIYSQGTCFATPKYDHDKPLSPPPTCPEEVFRVSWEITQPQARAEVFSFFPRE